MSDNEGSAIVDEKNKKPSRRLILVRALVNFFSTIEDEMCPIEENGENDPSPVKAKGPFPYFPSLSGASLNSVSQTRKAVVQPEARRFSNFDAGELKLYGGEILDNKQHLSTYRMIKPSSNMVYLTEWVENGEDSYYWYFINQDDFKDYEEWHSEYMAKFSPGTQHLRYPPPSDGYYPISIQTESGRSNTQNLDEMWIWCLANCSGEVRVLETSGHGLLFFFSDEEDAALFRLTL